MKQVQKQEDKLEIKSFWKPTGSPSPMWTKLMEILLRKPKDNKVKEEV